MAERQPGIPLSEFAKGDAKPKGDAEDDIAKINRELAGSESILDEAEDLAYVNKELSGAESQMEQPLQEASEAEFGEVLANIEALDAESAEVATEKAEQVTELQIADFSRDYASKTAKKLFDGSLKTGKMANWSESYLRDLEGKLPDADKGAAMDSLIAQIDEMADNYAELDADKAAALKNAAGELEQLRVAMDPIIPVRSEAGRGFLAKLDSGEFTSPDAAKQALSEALTAAENDPAMLKRLKLENMSLTKAVDEKFTTASGAGVEMSTDDIDDALSGLEDFDETGS